MAEEDAVAVSSNGKRSLARFRQGNRQCYDRSKEPFTFVVDSHIHFRPFGGHAIPMGEIDDYLRDAGVLFANAYGIGQTLPVDSTCDYYLDCPDTPVIPSIKNDFRNASNLLEFEPEGIQVRLSMSFPDLAVPEEVVPQIGLLDREYPGMFSWMGEVNLVKQALFRNAHRPTPFESIAGWAGFMAQLRKRDMPLSIHADLGNDAEPTKYLFLMEEVLRQYPNNRIVWAHMGLSKELAGMDPDRHLAIMKRNLEAYPLLMLDLSWRVLEDAYFSKPAIRERYVEFLNAYPERVLTGTDFVASRRKDFSVYQDEVEVTSRINQHLDDNAFRRIALGENYFRLLSLDFQAPPICSPH